MNNQNQNEYPLPKDSYVAFDAINLRNLILKRLDEQGVYTDHNYIGSNLASIIDIISYAYNTLIFYLHKTSNESMFTEAQLTENINRIVKLLDYKPVGYQTSTLTYRITANRIAKRGVYTIPRYSTFYVGDSPYSFNEDVSFSIPQDNSIIPLTELDNKKLLYQGVFREYATYTASGNNSEILVVNAGSEKVDHSNVFVYVYEKQKESWYEYKEVPFMYSESAQSRCFEKRLNSNGCYEITFGNNINGKRLSSGDSVAVYYLVSNSNAGTVGPRAMKNSNPYRTLYATPRYIEILQSVNTENLIYINKKDFSLLTCDNDGGSTLPVEAEGAESIRNNAPSIFRTQNRLVTKTDYESYIKTNFTNVISDVKVFDNWDYTTSYLKYFNKISVKPEAFSQMLLNQIQFADNCNFNNVYVCGTPRTSERTSFKYLLPSQKELIKSSLDSLRTITTEITFLDPVYRAVGFGVTGLGSLGITEADISQLEIIKQTYSNRSNSAIAQEAIGVIESFFDLKDAKIGNMFDYTALVSELLSIKGVESLRTRRTDTNETFHGLSFLMWNQNYPEMDFGIVANNRSLQPFELLYFYDSGNIASKIIVTDK